ncbi:MAG: thioredoxin family protein [Cyanobacteria bacterium]|nr:thioredoxin family protein [Cyanobacteriota bacterium]
MSLENACVQDTSTFNDSAPPAPTLSADYGPSITLSTTDTTSNTRSDITREGFPQLRLSSSDPARDGTYSTAFQSDGLPTRNYYASAQTEGQTGPYGQRPGPRPNRPDNPPQPRPDNPPQPRPQPVNPVPQPTDNRPPTDTRPPGDRPNPNPFQPGANPGAGNNFSPQQISEILRMRDRALELNRTQPQTPPTDTRPDTRPTDNRPQRPDRPNRPNRPNRPDDRVQRTSFETNEVDQAIEAARQSGRPLVVKVGFPGCPGCDRMTSGSWPSVQQDLQQNAIFLNVNVRADRNAGNRFPADSYPTVLVYNVADGTLNNNNIVARDSYMNASQLRQFLSNAYDRHRNNR